jgi:toxin ParE1/3/4
MHHANSNYLLSNIAVEDLTRIHQYGVKTFGTAAAEIYLDQFFNTFEKIASRPWAFEEVPHIRPGYRRCVCGVDRIYFREHLTKVEIIAIIGRQDFSSRF